MPDSAFKSFAFPDFKPGKAALNHQGNTFFQGLTSTFT